ncbi:MAG: hypothetical protein K0U38_10345 [Epsilonproteobacteria bacterium]|nr:hypothetical protein [Campylobacterota bacterium]
MKKVFQLQQEKVHPDRVIESIKNELRKYIKRERKKKLPNSETMYWDFDCKFGQSASSTDVCSFDEIIKALGSIQEKEWTECYIEIMAKAVDKPKKEEAE